jgi:phosphoserine phosphatase
MGKAIATTPLIDSGGCYTGEVEFYAHGPDKADAITRLAEEESLDLAGSWAYSDSITDLPMLESVGHPVVVNPDRNLRREAARREWPVLEFENPVALGDRIPIDRNWILATTITFAVFFGVMSTIRRFRRRA